MYVMLSMWLSQSYSYPTVRMEVIRSGNCDNCVVLLFLSTKISSRASAYEESQTIEYTETI